MNERQSWLTTLGWAAYLACSWTWCIGMFLPVLLVRDFGIWGFVVFAVPNVVGAAGMGWVLRTGEAARAIVERHRDAVRLFSLVTVGFQWYFLAWLLSANLATGIFAMMAPVLGIILATLFVPRRYDFDRVLTGIMLTFSFGALAVLGMMGELAMPIDSAPSGMSVLYLAPVCMFGFVLCPYLDRTFLKARERQPNREAAASFTLGFFGLFFPMIVFTLLYAKQFIGVTSPTGYAAPGGIACVLVGAHILGQLIATSSLHKGEWKWTVLDKGDRGLLLGVLGGVALICTVGTLSWLKESQYAGLTVGEIVYRSFMSFYGLAFPAYVWLCMIPARGEVGTQRPSLAKLRVLAVTVMLAAPCYWMGFIERETWWLGPGLFIVLAARVFVKKGQAGPAPSTA